MNVFPLQNANSSVISVTGTASYVLPLIDSAGAVSHSFYPGLDALDITPENGDIRIMIDPSTGALAPTASKGFLLKQGATLMLRHTSLRYIKVISTSGTVSCSLQVGESEPGETTVISGAGSGGTGTGASQVQGNAAAGATDVGNPVKTGGVYNTSAPTLSNGQRGDTQMDVNANTLTRETYVATFENNTDQVAMTLPRAVATNTGVVSLDVSSALEASSVTKASAGRLYALSGYIDATAPSATYYIQILNAASLPADGAVTHLVEPKQIVHATGSPSYFSYDYGLFGRYASTGIVVCISTTQFTKTISGAYLAMTAAYL